MRGEFYLDSLGKGKLHCVQWTPSQQPRAMLQIIHGIAEFVERYDDFAEYLNSCGILVVAEDHMGHGGSIAGGSTQGFFHGGWFTAVDDTMQLLRKTRAEHPDIPYVLFGHSMGSFMARTILCRYPDSGISSAIICGTCWQPRAVLPAVVTMCSSVASYSGEENPNENLQNLVFGGYNKRISNPRTPSDWLSRDEAVVDAYEAHPLCGFIPSSGLLRDMMIGLRYDENSENLSRMKKNLPVFIIGGEEDPVGLYGKSVPKTAKEFRRAGMENVSEKIYPGMRHEILNEMGKELVYRDILEWIIKENHLN